MSLDVTLTLMRPVDVFDRNITHNLNKMAIAAGIYNHIWRPDEIGIERASQLIIPLTEGLAKLKADPEHFKTFNPVNGWGSYNTFVDFVTEYLAACKLNPTAEITAER